MYAAMAWRGFFPREKLWNEFNRVGGELQEHCNFHLAGVEAVTGSLGMGLSNACGFAWAAGRRGQAGRRVYCLLGDGECTEGQTWEGVGLAAQLRLDNVVGILDYNKYIISASVAEVMNLEPIESRFADFGWHVSRVDGHDVMALKEAVETAARPETAPGKPRIVICDTVKGRGIGFMEREAVNWHAGHLDAESRLRCLEELGVAGGNGNG
jgi:Transketolase, N-terminal subunit